MICFLALEQSLGQICWLLPHMPWKWQYVCASKQLQHDSNIAVRWFDDSHITANPESFQSIILSRDRIDQFHISLDGHVISRWRSLNMLVVTLDDNLNFNVHVRNICQTASCHVIALKRNLNFLNAKCRMNVYKSFINANFHYCPIVWLFCGKTYLKQTRNIAITGACYSVLWSFAYLWRYVGKEWSATHPAQIW